VDDEAGDREDRRHEEYLAGQRGQQVERRIERRHRDAGQPGFGEVVADVGVER